jgi:ribosomal protein RSM22 (predicted rRNA methylase)
MDSNLPAELHATLERLAQGKSGSDMARWAASISSAYRDGVGSAHVIANADAALAYAFCRLPATYAALSAVFDALAEAAPDFSPKTILDVGAGPGTAAWAASARYPDLRAIVLVDENPFFGKVAADLVRDSATAALRAAECRTGELDDLLPECAPADLTIASYLFGELRNNDLARVADGLWSKTTGIMTVVEAGTPAGFARIRRLRGHLIGRGAHVICPCPHDLDCPMTGADWCHFSQRLNRSRTHRQTKQASLSFEDEKFSYVVLSRRRPRDARARVLARPRITKGSVTTKLCTPNGLAIETVQRRDGDEYKRRKNWRWGDAVFRTRENS